MVGAETCVSVEDLHLSYRVSYEKAPTLKSSLRNLGRRSRGHRTIEALRGVSIDVPMGAVLGIVGANGAGKSTLLRAIGGILPPSAGRITVRGRTTTLLSLGVGFNKQLSGRENILLGGLAAGLSPQQVADRLDDIAEFTALGEFIDLPVKTYSSGMYSRLAFSVAVHMDPDVLLVDEALSAGDEAFKKQASAKMADLVGTASSILLVSHSMSSIRDMSSHVVWLDHGKVMGFGDPVDVVTEYKKWISKT